MKRKGLIIISGTAGSATQPPTASTGDILTYTMQFTGTGLFAKRDISVMSLSYIDAPTYSGNSVSLANRTLLGEKWSFDTALRWYGQNDTSTNTKITRLSPSLRTGYKWKEKVTLEAEIGAEKSTTHNPTTHDDTSRNYWSLGYRWDF
jgi:maltoporin